MHLQAHSQQHLTLTPTPNTHMNPCLQAADDPIAPKEAIPFKALADNPNCVLVLTPTGGHLGWCSGREGPTGMHAVLLPQLG